ncbi:hypothetical protein FHT29_006028 [Rhizobium sp. SG741]|nr:hypothetical protein [Rhizobium sp. SG741]
MVLLKGLEPPTPSFSRYVRAEYPCTASCLLSGMADMAPEGD